jgi:hypothetical protein
MSDGLFEQIIQELESSKEAIRLSNVVMFSEPLRSTLSFALQAKRFSLTELTEQLKFTRDQSRRIAELLAERGFLKILSGPYNQEPEYETQLTG